MLAYDEQLLCCNFQAGMLERHSSDGASNSALVAQLQAEIQARKRFINAYYCHMWQSMRCPRSPVARPLGRHVQ